DLNELRDEFSQKKNSKLSKKKAIIKKVIGNMTVGINMSSLYVEVLECLKYDDIEIKKLVHLYLINYGRMNPKMTDLAIPLLEKEAISINPLYRANSIRTMSYINTEKVILSLTDQLRISLSDKDPFVKKTAALALLKVFRYFNSLFDEEPDLLDLLKTHLTDENPTVIPLSFPFHSNNTSPFFVVSNAVTAFREISLVTPTLTLNFNYNIARKLSLALNECNEWNQINLLTALMNTVPQTHDEAESLIQRIIPRFQHSNSGVVLASIRLVCYLMNYISDKESLSDLCGKITNSLVTLLKSGPQIRFITLRNIILLNEWWSPIMQGQIHALFCKFNEPNYVKLEKLELLVRLVDLDSASLVLMELAEYALEPDQYFVEKVIHSIGRIAIKLAPLADNCVAIMIKILDSNQKFSIHQIVIAMAKIMQKYPYRYKRTLPRIFGLWPQITDDEAKSALIWIAGSYIDSYKLSETILKSLSENFLEESAMVQLSLLTALAKSFVSKKTKLNGVIRKLMKSATEKINDPDVRDRALFYSKLLTLSPESGKKIVSLRGNFRNYYAEPIDVKKLESLLLQVSTLSSIYFVPQNQLFKDSKELYLPESPALVKYRFPSSNLEFSFSEIENENDPALPDQVEDFDSEQLSPKIPNFASEIINYDPYSTLADIPTGDNDFNSPTINIAKISPFLAQTMKLSRTGSNANQLVEDVFSELVNSPSLGNDSSGNKNSSNTINMATTSPAFNNFSDINPLNKTKTYSNLLANSPGYNISNDFSALNLADSKATPSQLNRYSTMPSLNNARKPITQSSFINDFGLSSTTNPDNSISANGHISPKTNDLLIRSSTSAGKLNSPSLGITQYNGVTPLNSIGGFSPNNNSLNISSNNIQPGVGETKPRSAVGEDSTNSRSLLSKPASNQYGLGISSDNKASLPNNFSQPKLKNTSSLGEMNFGYNNGLYNNLGNSYNNGFIQPNPNLETTQSHKLLDSRQTNGLDIYGVFERVGDKVMFVLSLTNNSVINLSDFAIQFNLNTFGLVPKYQLPIPNNLILQTQTVSAGIELIVNDQTMIKHSSPINSLQIALKCNLGEFYFATKFSMHILLLDSIKGKLDQGSFLQLWGSFNMPQNASTVNFSDLKYRGLDTIKDKLNMNNVFTVAQRQTDQFFVFYTSCVLFDLTTFVSELKITFDFVHAQIITKSSRPDFNPSICETFVDILTK
ncbi:Beta-adaptin-like protein C, partial [Smittium mucronatum]